MSFIPVGDRYIFNTDHVIGIEKEANLIRVNYQHLSSKTLRFDTDENTELAWNEILRAMNLRI